MSPDKLVLVTGATGYIGGCLIPRLLDQGHQVRVLVRDPACLSGRSFLSQVEVVNGDLLAQGSLDQSMQGVSTAYYLVHNMSSGWKYVDRELDSARNFASAAGINGLEHIIYLGGLADPADKIGSHLRSRIMTGDVLRQGSVPVTEFRASLVIGSGSISFEMIRYLSEQFPILFGPHWMHNRTQPIAIENVLEYLLSALEAKTCRGKIYEIGGEDVLTYAEVISTYSRVRGLKRLVISLPGMSAKFMGQLAGKVTPIPANIAAPLLGGMRTDSVVRDDMAKRDFPQIKPYGYEFSIMQALDRLTPGNLQSIFENTGTWFRIKKEGFFVEGMQTRFRGGPEASFRAIICLGGKRGWLYMNWLWKFRGFLDRVVGGPGLRGRREEDALVEGEILDFYRVEVLEPDKRLLLKSELKAPGLGWMEWRLDRQAEGDVIITQVAYFAPRGLAGFLYWYILLPVHHKVFTGLLRALARQAVEIQQAR